MARSAHGPDQHLAETWRAVVMGDKLRHGDGNGDNIGEAAEKFMAMAS